MATLMVSLFVIGMWSGLITPAYAAALNQSRSSSATDQISSRSALAAHDAPRSQQPPVKPHATPQVSSGAPFDGLGDLPFYTYITYPIDDHLELKVNVANGNLVAHMSNLHIKGTGIDESIEGYYNSQASFSRDLGNNWNFNQGHDVRLDISNPTAGITLYGPSGFSAFFAYNSSTGTWSDPPGLNATLVKNGDGTYTLTFHRSGEKLVFGTNSHLAAEKDKNGNTISYSYNSTHDLLSLTDSQARVTNFTHNTALGSSHDPSGQITSLTDPAGRTVHYTYNERGNPVNSLTSVTDLMGKTTTFDYSGGDLTTITDPLGNVTTISYLTGDKVGTITDATKQGQLLFAYNSTNTVVTDCNGHNTTYYYDTNTSHQFMIASVQDALGNSKTTNYDANFNVTQYGDALKDLSNFVFSSDGRNNLNSVADGTNATTSFTYASSGSNLYYPLTQKDPQGNQTNYTYDSNGNLTTAINTGSNKGLTYT
jgi:YD repeat-containing protein